MILSELASVSQVYHNVGAYYWPANTLFCRTDGAVGSLERFPVRKRIELNGYIAATVLNLSEIDSWFNDRLTMTATISALSADQKWFILVGQTKSNLFNTVQDSDVPIPELRKWKVAVSLAGCSVIQVGDDDELRTLCQELDEAFLKNGTSTPGSVNDFMASIPHVGRMSDNILHYCGNVWSSIAFLTHRDLIKTLPMNPHAQNALGKNFTSEQHNDIRTFFGLEPGDLGIGLYLEEPQ